MDWPKATFGGGAARRAPPEEVRLEEPLRVDSESPDSQSPFATALGHAPAARRGSEGGVDKVVATMHRKGAEALAVAYAAAGASATGWRCREGRRTCSSSNRLCACGPKGTSKAARRVHGAGRAA